MAIWLLLTKLESLSFYFEHDEWITVFQKPKKQNQKRKKRKKKTKNKKNKQLNKLVGSLPVKRKLAQKLVRVFANGPGDLGSIPGRVIPKTLKMELDTTLLNTQHYKVRFKGKVEQSWEWSSALPYTLV